VRNLTIDRLSKEVESTITDMVIVSVDEPLPSICTGDPAASNGRFTVSQTEGGADTKSHENKSRVTSSNADGRVALRLATHSWEVKKTMALLASSSPQRQTRHWTRQQNCQ
jgi:hypothetical protein